MYFTELWGDARIHIHAHAAYREMQNWARFKDEGFMEKSKCWTCNTSAHCRNLRGWRRVLQQRLIKMHTEKMWWSDVKWQHFMLWSRLDMFFCWMCHGGTYHPVSMCGGRRRGNYSTSWLVLSGCVWAAEGTEIVALPQQVWDILRLVGDVILFEACAFPTPLAGFVLFFWAGGGGRQLVHNNIIAVTIVGALKYRKRK